jgi:hypothetical protein
MRADLKFLALLLLFIALVGCGAYYAKQAMLTDDGGIMWAALLMLFIAGAIWKEIFAK